MLGPCPSFPCSSESSSGCTTRSTNRDTSTPSIQGQQAKFDFSGQMMIGNIQSRTALRLIGEWAVLHQAELQVNWEQMKAGQPLDRIAPLE